jgi:hypothetical protein
VLAVVVLLLELLAVLLIAVPVSVLRTLSDKWQCEVIGPGGDHFHVPAGSLSEGTRPAAI